MLERALFFLLDNRINVWYSEYTINKLKGGFSLWIMVIGNKIYSFTDGIKDLIKFCNEMYFWFLGV